MTAESARPWVSFVIVSKDEPELDLTLRSVRSQAAAYPRPHELLVVDASHGRLDLTRRNHPEVRWIDYTPPPGTSTSIAQQRNVGVRAARGAVIVFTDSGCVPQPGWLTALLAPIADGSEDVTAGGTAGRGPVNLYGGRWEPSQLYLESAATINLALRREAFDAVGGFDESFAYGSDVDFTWRLMDAGYRLRNVRAALVGVDWGSRVRQLRRAWRYGRAWARLYRKHKHRVAVGWQENPVPFAYAAFLLGLPLSLRFRLYPWLLVIPALRNRGTGSLLTLADHLLIGAGFLRELATTCR